MPSLGTKKYTVIVRQGKIKPRGGVENWLDRNYDVYAKTSAGAKRVVKDAGIHGVIIGVEKGG